MAGSKFQYDESGGTFFYFLLSFLALILIPISYYLWPKKAKKEESISSREKCQCDRCQLKQNRLTLNEPFKKWRVELTKGLIIIGWLAFLATAYKVAHLERDYVDWNPYDILQIDRGAAQAEIKRAYRKLSLLYHPDKDTGDAKLFLQLTKAHAALTDDEARKNWEMYGNPDGPGAMSFGIALPSWIVEKENSIWVLGLYALVFMVALPVIVGIWWKRSIKFGGDKVLLETTRLYYYYINKNPKMVLKRVLTIVAGSFEFDKSHNNEIVERPTDNVEIPPIILKSDNFGKSKEPCLSFPYSIKARAILHAHLSRTQLPPTTLELDRLYIVKKCPYLINELVQCVARMIMIALSGHSHSMPPLETIEACMRLCPMIVQALWEKKSAFLQLPHIQEDMLRHFHKKSRTIRNIRDLARCSFDDRRDVLRQLTQEQFDDVMKVCSQMPLVDLVVKAEVLGDDKSSVISCGAIVTVTIILQRKPLLTDTFKPQIEEREVKDEEEEEGDEQIESKPNEGEIVTKKKPPVWQKQKKKGKAGKPKKKTKQFANQKKTNPADGKPEPIKEKEPAKSSKSKPENDGGSDSSDNDSSSKDSHSEGGKDDKSVESVESDESEDEDWTQLQSKLSHKEKVVESKSHISHTVHCPFFPDEKQEYWWLYIVDQKQHLLMTSPYYITDLVDNKEITLQITAPEKVGIYTYYVHLRSDSYIDGDFKEQFKLDVKEVEKGKEPVYGISDDEKDESEKEDDDSTGLMTDEDASSNSSDDDDDGDDKQMKTVSKTKH